MDIQFIDLRRAVGKIYLDPDGPLTLYQNDRELPFEFIARYLWGVFTQPEKSVHDIKEEVNKDGITAAVDYYFNLQDQRVRPTPPPNL